MDSFLIREKTRPAGWGETKEEGGGRESERERARVTDTFGILHLVQSVI